MAHSTLVSIPSSNVSKNISYPPKDKQSSKRSFREKTSLDHNKTLRLAGWKISGKDHLCQQFQKQLPDLLVTQGEVHLQEIMTQPGESGLAGAVGDKLMQFHEI